MDKPGLIIAVLLFAVAVLVPALPKVRQNLFPSSPLAPPTDQSRIDSFQSCAQAGYPVLESYPRQCRTPDGRNFMEEVPSSLPPPSSGVRPAGAYDGCVITGCSAQVCAEEEVFTTCEFRPEYACYREAVCGRQQSGECGWTQSEILQSCLENAL